jgi:uncharacterized protein
MNRLADETSPYLRQHADNPVDWFAWGPDAFATAAERDVPVLLSVGYSACHWCHVMAHECFEHDDVAAVMNESFVCVKVDREERPDVDAVYMEAVQRLTGQGGWPMTVFLAPDGQPFYGGTYFPRPTFLQLMRAVADAWRDRRAELLQQAGSLTDAIGEASRVVAADLPPGAEALEAALARLTQSYDVDWGGFGRAPKFPQTMNLELVLSVSQGRPGEALDLVVSSLDAMASGGIYDHLGGGFARYSVDDHWLVPHFEKMLYDQALLARLALHVWQVTGEARHRQVLDETIAYVLRDLRHPLGGFYSAEDADSEGHEGRFYVWTPTQLRDVLGDDLAAEAMAWWGVTEDGNFEGANILHRPTRGDLVRPPAVDEARRLLFAAREQRVRPGLDDKVLTEWNGLFLTTLAEAAAATGDATWLAAAVVNGEFLLAELRRPDGRWLRSWQHDGGARHLALAADHAALVEAFVALAEATGQARWVAAATETADSMLDLFWDPDQGGVFTTAEDGERLVVRQKDLLDGATPSANSMTAKGLYRLAALTGEPRFAHHADRVLQLVAAFVAQAPTAFGHLLGAVGLRLAGVTEVAVVGERPDLVRVVHERYLPNAVLAWGEPYASPLWEGRRDGWAYVCRDYVCQAPTDDATSLDVLLRG